MKGRSSWYYCTCQWSQGMAQILCRLTQLKWYCKHRSSGKVLSRLESPRISLAYLTQKRWWTETTDHCRWIYNWIASKVIRKESHWIIFHILQFWSTILRVTVQALRSTISWELQICRKYRLTECFRTFWVFRNSHLIPLVNSRPYFFDN